VCGCATEQNNPDVKYQVTFSMLEIYMENTRDLMNPQSGNLKASAPALSLPFPACSIRFMCVLLLLWASALACA
jgi:hypothetical protein